MAGKFRIRSQRGEVRFELQAGNGEVLLRSPLYASKASVIHGIESVRRNAASAVVIDDTAELIGEHA